jgi:hypothetical protein
MIRLEEINGEYLTHFHASFKRMKESNDIYHGLRSLQGKRSRDATVQRARLKERQAEIMALHHKVEATLLRAAEIYDKLSPAEKERVRAQPWAVIDHLERNRRSSLTHSGVLA